MKSIEELLALTPYQFLTQNGESVEEVIENECYSDYFKEIHGFRPRADYMFTEEAVRDFYNSNYKVRAWENGNPFDEFSPCYLGFTDAQEEEFRLADEYEEEQIAKFELEMRWDEAEHTGDFSEVRKDFESNLTTSQEPIGSIGLVF